MDFHERIAANAATVEAHLNAYLDTYEHQPVVDAMRYAVQGGKRMRAYMVIESAPTTKYSGISPTSPWTVKRPVSAPKPPMMPSVKPRGG